MFIDDPSGTLGAQATAEIQAIASPFDVKVIVTSAPSKAALDAQVSGLVNSANTLAIGIDPVHHATFTHFGVGTGIASSHYQEVARAGNGEFHAGHWGDGIKAIVASATATRREAHETTTTIVVPTSTQVVEHPFPVTAFVVAGAALLFGFFLLWRWNKKRAAAMDETLGDWRDEAQQMRTRNLEEQSWHDKMAAKESEPVRQSVTRATAPSRRAELARPRAPAYAPPAAPVYVAAPQPQVVVAGNGGNDMLTGMLIGEAMASRPVERERVVERNYSPPPVKHDSPAPSYSSSSSWGDSSSSSGGFDSGSSGGDFGGGFDGGGGGGDF